MLRRLIAACSILTLFMFTAAGTVAAESPNTLLWYRQPAATWVEAMPIGNGSLGAMVFGDPVGMKQAFAEGGAEAIRGHSASFPAEAGQVAAAVEKCEASPSALASLVKAGLADIDGGWPASGSTWARYRKPSRIACWEWCPPGSRKRTGKSTSGSATAKKIVHR